MLEEEEIFEKEATYLDEETDAIICSRLGFDDEKIIFGTFKKLIAYDKKEELKEPICVIVPGDMHEMELTFLKQFALKN